MAQYPLGMGADKESAATAASNTLAVQLDAQGKVKYDVLARQGHSKDKVGQHSAAAEGATDGGGVDSGSVLWLADRNSSPTLG